MIQAVHPWFPIFSVVMLNWPLTIFPDSQGQSFRYLSVLNKVEMHSLLFYILHWHCSFITDVNLLY
jgi:hypothetical protein